MRASGAGCGVVRSREEGRCEEVSCAKEDEIDSGEGCDGGGGGRGVGLAGEEVDGAVLVGGGCV